jgi:hypothetical protein
LTEASECMLNGIPKRCALPAGSMSSARSAGLPVRVLLLLEMP